MTAKRGQNFSLIGTQSACGKKRATTCIDECSISGRAAPRQRPRKNLVRVLRTAAAVGILLIYGIGVVFDTGLGSLSAFGIGSIAMVCPLGALETMLAGRFATPLLLLAIFAAAIGAVLFGRAFCSWVCPVPLVRKSLTNKSECDAFNIDRKKRFAPSDRPCSSSKNGAGALGVLAVALVTAFVFGFPVFCLVCPIGLVFASISAVIRLIMFNELLVDVIIFPILIVVELLLLRKWCATLCPIGALLGLFARLNRTFVPVVNKGKCLALSAESSCNACNAACDSDIDLVHNAGAGSLPDCTKCHKCADCCPAAAISFPVLPPKKG